LNDGFHGNYTGPDMQTAQNFVWKTSPVISYTLYSPSKFFFAYINDDSELDMYVFQNSQRIKWVNDVREAPLDYVARNVTQTRASAFKLFDIDGDYIQDIIIIDNTKKKLILAKKLKSSVFPEWREEVIVNLLDHEEYKDLQLTSFVFRDLNLDGTPDIVISAYVNKSTTYLLKAINLGKREFKIELIPNFSALNFMLIDSGDLDVKNKNPNDFLVATGDTLSIISQDIVDQEWKIFEVSSKPFFTDPDLDKMNSLGGLCFHLYILDFDQDGYLDIIIPDKIENKLGYLKNPGIVENPEHQWKFTPIIESSLGESNRLTDFVMINVDKSRQLVPVLLFENSVSMFYPTQSVNTSAVTYTEVPFALYFTKDARDMKNKTFSNIYDILIGKGFSAEFIIYSQESGSLLLLEGITAPLLAGQSPYTDRLIWTRIDHPSPYSYNWKCNFWFYLIIYMYSASMILGILHFTCFIKKDSLYDFLKEK
jgi:hypothetical protein